MLENTLWALPLLPFLGLFRFKTNFLFLFFFFRNLYYYAWNFGSNCEMCFNFFFLLSDSNHNKIHTSTRLLFWQNNVIIPADSVREKSLLWNGLTPTLLTLWLISLKGAKHRQDFDSGVNWSVCHCLSELSLKNIFKDCPDIGPSSCLKCLINAKNAVSERLFT